MSGEDIAFLYPDLRIAIVGTFIHGRLIIGQTAFLRKIEMLESLLCPYFTTGSGKTLGFKETFTPTLFNIQYC
jgi:hypothetical protein